jgi:hypothetical protein
MNKPETISAENAGRLDLLLQQAINLSYIAALLNVLMIEQIVGRERLQDSASEWISDVCDEAVANDWTIDQLLAELGLRVAGP